MKRRAAAGLWVALAASAALLFWVADGIAGMESAPGYAGHYYEYLVDGFLRGHTYLSVAPAPQLAKLRDPYDPSQNAPFRLSDASYYAGRYYLYYGPTPALVLMVPWRLLTGRHLPERLAAVVFSVLALAGLGRLLWEVRERHFPALPGWALAGILFTAMHAAWLPVTLRRPGFWELPHAAALACLWWTLYFLWRCRLGGGRAAWALAVGAGLALLLGSRPTFLFAAGAIAILASRPWANKGPRGTAAGWRTAIFVAVPLAAGVGALVLYNLARFGRPAEFGQSYQLLNADELHTAHFRAAFLAFNARLYLFSLPELSPYFPFVKTVWPGVLPAGYGLCEEMHGALFALPVHLAGWAGLAWAWRRRREPGMGALSATLAGAVAASAFAAAILFSWAGACSRYLTELTGGWTFATAIGLMAIFAPGGAAAGGSGFSWRGPLRLLAGLAAAWTIAYVWLASFEHGGLFRGTNPAAYSRLARTLDYPSLWDARREGVVFGPVELDVALAPYHGPDAAVLMASGRPGMMNRFELRRTDAGHVSLSLLADDVVVAEIPRLAVPDGRLRIRIEAPWLYPPEESPYWDSFADRRERRDRQTRFAIGAGTESATAYSERSFDSTRFEPFVLGAGPTAWIESMQRLSTARR